MRFIPHTPEDIKSMMDTLEIKSIDELFMHIPDDLKLKQPLKLPNPLSEMELLNRMNQLSNVNKGVDKLLNFIGAGAYEHFIPAVVRHVLCRSEFYTAYTPYQPEISQGVLQAMFEYQTFICELTGMAAANASLYDGASALAEAAIMTCQATRRNEVLIPLNIHPEYRKTLQTYLGFQGINIIQIGHKDGTIDLDFLKHKVSKSTAGVLLQNPNFFGCLEDIKEIADVIHDVGGLLVVSHDPIALGILEAPGTLGADIVTGEGQGLGLPLSFGGPYLGFMAVTQNLVRKMPGRIVGMTHDKNGNRGFVLTLQAREQHIRREKATSNICSNEALCALAAAVYLTYMGKQGIREVAERCVYNSHYCLDKLAKIKGIEVEFVSPFFKEFTIRVSGDLNHINRRLLENGVLGGYLLEKDYPEFSNRLLVCVTETKNRAQIDGFVDLLEGLL
jgi:glycine dehydrogenase subunit 1